jgi:exonuclease III
LSRFVSDKNNGRINHRLADIFNDWVNKWGLIELNPENRKFTWANNQNNLVLVKLDRVFISTSLEARFPLIKIVCLGKGTSDHNPILLSSGEGATIGSKRFRFEKWWG